MERPVAEAPRSGDSVQNREIVVERADGSRGVVLVNIAPLKDRSGNIVGAVNCFQDVTERRSPLWLVKPNTEQRTSRNCSGDRSSFSVRHYGGSKDTIEAPIGRSLRSMRCSFSRAGQEPGYLASLTKNSRHTFEKVSCVCELMGQICS
jgi:hypothetical protein